MSKPIISWQGLDNDALATVQEDFHYNKEPDVDNTTHLGTKFVGDVDNASVGLDLGAMTNLQEGDEFPLIISHSATEPITNVQFYFTVSTNVRGDATGFANESDGTADGLTGAEKDFAELVAWGDGKINADDTAATVDNSLYLYGMRIRYWNEIDPTPMATDVMNELAFSKLLTNDGKFAGALGNAGTSPDGEEAWVEPWVDSVSNDAVALKLSLSIPDIEAAGLRNCALTMRLTYTF